MPGPAGRGFRGSLRRSDPFRRSGHRISPEGKLTRLPVPHVFRAGSNVHECSQRQRVSGGLCQRLAEGNLPFRRPAIMARAERDGGEVCWFFGR